MDVEKGHAHVVTKTINDIYNLPQEKPLTADEKSYPVLNAILTLPSVNSRSEPDALPVLAAEFIVTDLSARHLAFCLQIID